MLGRQDNAGQSPFLFCFFFSRLVPESFFAPYSTTAYIQYNGDSYRK